MDFGFDHMIHIRNANIKSTIFAERFETGGGGPLGRDDEKTLLPSTFYIFSWCGQSLLGFDELIIQSFTLIIINMNNCPVGQPIRMLI